ncbi:MAG: hypothetical protein NVSMB51_01510 [Solirubrobacteraceae bacterium]
MSHARNIAILLALAAVVTFLPGGGNGAAFVGAVLSITFAGALALVAVRTYQERRLDIYGLGDAGRAVLYGSLAGLALLFAGSARLLASGAGTLAFFAGLALCAFGLLRSYQAWRQG